MTKNKGQTQLVNWTNASDTVSVGANGGWSDTMLNLFTELETLSGADGLKPKVSMIRLHFRIYGTLNETDVFCAVPCIVQTNGTWTDTTNLTGRGVQTLLDSSVDDVFGYHAGTFHLSRKMPAVAATGHATGMEFSMTLPRHLLNILNKETETERLQALHVGVVGSGTANTTLQLHLYAELHYVLERVRTLLR